LGIWYWLVSLILDLLPCGLVGVGPLLALGEVMVWFGFWLFRGLVGLGALFEASRSGCYGLHLAVRLYSLMGQRLHRTT